MGKPVSVNFYDGFNKFNTSLDIDEMDDLYYVPIVTVDIE